MFKNYLKTAWRNLKSHKAYAAINIFGLAVGIGASLLIYIVIHYELSYDSFEKNKDRIYRVVSTYTNPLTHEITEHESSTTPPLSKALRNDIPQIEKVANIWNVGGAQIHIPIPGKDVADEKRVKENNGLFFAEPDLFSIFDYTWLAGDSKKIE